MEMGAAYLAAGLSPEQWLQQQRQRYYFVLLLTICILSFVLVGAALVLEPKVVDDRSGAQEIATRLVAKIHEREFDGAYEMYAEELKRDVNFAQFRTGMLRGVFQLPTTKPLKQTFEQVRENGGALFFFFITEFGDETRIRDIVTFGKTGPNWTLRGYNWQPFEWPLTWVTPRIRQSAAVVMKAYVDLPEEERSAYLPYSLRGSITGSMPGWSLVVESTTSQKIEHRCEVRTHEAESSIRVDLKNTIGGCALTPGQRIVVWAVLSGVSDSRVEVDQVQYFPESG